MKVYEDVRVADDSVFGLTREGLYYNDVQDTLCVIQHIQLFHSPVTDIFLIKFFCVLFIIFFHAE